MTDLVKSLIRTYVPYLVAAAVSVGLLPDTLSDTAVTVFTGLLFGGYYLLVRLLEERWPWFGHLLGTKTAPTYES